MKYTTHVVSLVFAGVLLGWGTLFFPQNQVTGSIALVIGMILYFYGYRIKRK